MNKFREVLVEYDNDNLVVYCSHLDDDDYWIEYDTHTDVDNPESFAHGYAEAIKAFGVTAQVIPVEDE
jgi:hypothetical protein